MAENLAERLDSVDSTVELLRNADLEFNQYVFPDEYTNWIEEQRAVRETCAVVDQSYHMESCFVEGPEAIDFLEQLAVNSFATIRSEDPPRAINLVMCNPDGYIIGDQILFYLGENQFSSVGSVWANNWIRYNAETRDYDVAIETPYGPYMEDTPPHRYRFQIQGPNALDAMDEVIDGGVPDISFFAMDTIQIDGHDAFALGHGMAATPGLEIFGPYEHHDEVLDDILTAGEEYGIRRLGSKAYKTGKIGSGWLVGPVPAIYESDEMRGYREWLEPDGTEASYSIGGSFVSEDVRDYYMTPMERGQGHLVSFDHEFVGREALEERIDDPARELVTFVWETADGLDVYASLFEEGDTKKYIDLPDPRNLGAKNQYDAVLKDGETVGLSISPKYDYNERAILSLCPIDSAYSEPGTEVTVVWGEEDVWRDSDMRHVQTEIDATVAPAPYLRGREDL
jgi:vanillate/3-O-methylgallate O-demethylase